MLLPRLASYVSPLTFDLFNQKITNQFDNYDLTILSMFSNLANFIISNLDKIAKILLVEEFFRLQKHLNTIMSDLIVPLPHFP